MMDFSMFAVIKTGGKQYKVSPNDVIFVEKLEANPGDVIALENVLAVGNDNNVTIGAPRVEGASVAAEVVDQRHTPTMIIFKKRRRKNSRRRNGHRQQFTVLKISEILTGGQKVKTSTAPLPANFNRSFEALSVAEGTADNLTLLGNVSHLIASGFHKAGIFHFWQVANLTEEAISKVESHIGFQGDSIRTAWPKQARSLLLKDAAGIKIAQKVKPVKAA
jgi:large subunit ribosomal protein L21